MKRISLLAAFLVASIISYSQTSAGGAASAPCNTSGTPCPTEPAKTAGGTASGGGAAAAPKTLSTSRTTNKTQSLKNELLFIVVERLHYLK